MKRIISFGLTFISLFILCASNAYANATSGERSYGMWVINNYVDDFKEPTDIEYIEYARDITGTFCNSAVQDKRLTVEWAIDKEDVTVFLYEYGTSLVTGYSSSTISYNVTMRDASGKDTSLIAYLYEGNDRLHFSDASAKEIRETFSKGGKVSFFLQNNRRKIETYLFTMDSTIGFSIAWNYLLDVDLYATLKEGSYGDNVVKMKKRLQELGYFTSGASLSNTYNSITTERVKQFQKENDLPQTGIADKATLQLLYSDKAKYKPIAAEERTEYIKTKLFTGALEVKTANRPISLYNKNGKATIRLAEPTVLMLLGYDESCDMFSATFNGLSVYVKGEALTVQINGTWQAITKDEILSLFTDSN